MKRLFIGFAVLVGLYALTITLGGLFAGSCVGGKVEDRLGKALAADVSVGEASVFIATGKVRLQNVEIKRDGVDIRIESIDVEMAGGGLMLLDDELDKVTVREARASLSARGVLSIVQKREPVYIGELVIEDATASISPTLFFPGLGAIEATVERARSRDVNLASAVSWLADLDEMVVSAELPGGAGGRLAFSGGEVSISGSWFGSNPLSFPFTIPELGPELLEVEQLQILGKALFKAVSKHLAKDKLIDAAKSLLD